MITLPANLAALLQAENAFRYATLWKIARTDGTTLYFTDHSEDILFEANTYTPAFGLDPSAQQKSEGLKFHNRDYRGAVDSTAITFDDLRAGRYREAEITEYTVDWMFPWGGAFVTNTYWIINTLASPQVWNAEVMGIARRLKTKRGRRYTKNCDNDLGDSLCQYDIEGDRVVGEVDSVSSVRKTFIDATLIGAGVDWYKFGDVTWTSGNNNALISEIRSFNNSTGQISFQLETPFDIAIGDDYTIVPGCIKDAATCKSKFSNYINYGGYDDVPGIDKMIQTPDARN